MSRKKIDLTGQKCGHLTVLEEYGRNAAGSVTWSCQCVCGAKVVASSKYLKEGGNQSCGCRSKFNEDISGQKFSYLTVLNKIGKNIWKCQCICGNEVDVRKNNLKSGNTKSCGCMAGRKKKDIAGKKFGYFTVLNECSKDKNGNILYKCICDCGNIRSTYGTQLRTGRTRSCGCATKEQNTKHNQSKSPIYGIWSQMFQRCYNPKDKRYKNYGSRGVEVCKRWWSFENFYSDMGDKPKGLILGRIDTSDDYKPSNCEWTTFSIQGRRRSGIKGYSWKKCAGKWVANIGVDYKTIHLGSFTEEEDAKQAYLEAKRNYHG